MIVFLGWIIYKYISAQNHPVECRELRFPLIFCVCSGLSQSLRSGEGDGSRPLSGFSSTCRSHSSRFWHPGGLCESGWQGQFLSPWSLIFVGQGTAWLVDPYYQYHTFLKCLSDIEPPNMGVLFSYSLSQFSWRMVCLELVSQGLPCLWTKTIIFLMMGVIYFHHRWRLANQWERMSESWMITRSPSRPAISVSWI